MCQQLKDIHIAISRDLDSKLLSFVPQNFAECFGNVEFSFLIILPLSFAHCLENLQGLLKLFALPQGADQCDASDNVRHNLEPKTHSIRVIRRHRRRHRRRGRRRRRRRRTVSRLGHSSVGFLETATFI